jgi:hypothetical protein
MPTILLDGLLIFQAPALAARRNADRAGPLATPPRIGSRRHPVLADGPGEYVHD